ncbi:T9SS type A sorting domain-containing protein [Flavobacterium nackdongense]|nr:T9SS type A sorting domain-containing protein [Flavobacterium nackdongense]
MNKVNRIICTLAIVFFSLPFVANSQVTLNADGPGNTYELINSVLAPSGNVIESPDQTPDGSHPTFGRHIAEVFDPELNKYVFEFYSHVSTGSTGILDNDISTLKTDRQRVEIKTYASSPNNLKGVIGETVTYKWRFKVPVGFKPSANFTHIHQIKPVDGDDDSPIFTLTARKGSPNKLQLIYVVDANGSNDYKREVNLSLFEGIWVEVIEIIEVGTGSSGSYSISIKKVSDGTEVLAYTNNNIQTIRTAATDPGSPQVANSFIRPKWGIYRSLLDAASLRDDSIRFSDFSIAEGTLSSVDFNLNAQDAIFFQNPVQDNLILFESAKDNYEDLRIYDSNGKLILSKKISSNSIDLSELSSGIYLAELIKNDGAKKVSKLIKK